MVENRGTRVYVGNLGEKVKKEDLETEFNKFGKLNNIWVAFNPPGFAFVEFESRNDAEKACDILNGTEILGSGKLRVEISKGRPKGRRDQRPGGGRFGGPPSRFGGGGGGGGGGRPQGGFRRSDDFRGSSGGGRFQSDSFSRGRSRDFGNGGSSYGGGGNRFSRDGNRFGSSGGGGGGFNRNGGGGGGGGGRFRSRSPRSRF